MQKTLVTKEIIELAKTYFVIKEGNVNSNYIGPKGEYQKWNYVLHKTSKNEYSKNWRIDNLIEVKKRDKIRNVISRFIDKLKALRRVSELETPVCVNCGIDDIRVLTINHKNGDGAKERKADKYRVSRLSRDIKNGRTTSDLDVRCYNCNILYEYEQGRRNLPLNYKELYGSGT